MLLISERTQAQNNPIQINGTNNFCDGESRTLQIPGAASTAKIQWYRNGRAIAGARSKTLIVNFSGTYTARDTFAGEITQWGPITLTRNVKPVASISPAGTQTICSNGFTTLTASAGDTYLWSNGATTRSIDVSTPGNYFVIVRNNTGCADTSETICVNPRPNSNFTTNRTSTCEGSTVNFVSNLNTPLCGTRSYEWSVEYVTGSCSVSDFTYTSGTNNKSLNPVIRFNNPGSYKVKLTNTWNNGGNCNASTTEQIITVTSKAAVNVDVSESICTGTPIAITATPLACFDGSSINYSWSFPGAAITTSNQLNPTNIVYNTPGTYTATLTQTSACGTTITNKTIQVLQSPNITSALTKTICSGDNANINITSAANPAITSFTWSVNSDPAISGAVAGSGANISDVLFNNSTSPKEVIYTVTASSVYGTSSCTSDPVNIVVTVNPKPIVNAIPSLTIRSGGSFVQALTEFNNFPNTTFTYTSSAAVTITGASNGSGATINQTLTNTGNTVATVVYTITASTLVNGNVCVSTPIDFIVYVNPIPQITNADTLILCEEPNFNLILNSNTQASNTSYSWYTTSVPSGINNIIQLGLTSSIPFNNVSIDDTATTHKQITYFVTPTFTNNGVSTTGAVKRIDVFMMPQPIMNPLADQLICSGDSVIFQPSSNTLVSNTRYRWVATLPSGLNGFTSGTGTQIRHKLVNTSGSPRTVVYQITPYYTLKNVDCDGETFFDTVIVNPKPTFQNQTRYVVCNETNFNIPLLTNTASDNPSSTIYSYTVQMPAGVFGATNGNTNTITGMINNTNANFAEVSYKVVASATHNGLTCVSDTFNIKVVVNPKPEVNPLPTKIINSGTSTNIALSTNKNANKTFYNWTVSANASITGATDGTIGGASPSINQTLTNTSNQLQYLVYTITPFYQNEGVDCFGASVQDTVYVLPRPIINTIGERTVCSNTTINVNITVNTNQNTSIAWTIVGGNNLTGHSAGTGYNINQTLANATNSPQTVIYRMVPTYTYRGQSFDGPASDFVVNVNNVPIIHTLQKPVICSGPFNYVPLTNSLASITSYSWTVRTKRGTTNGLQNGAGISIAANLVNTATIPDTIIYTITPIVYYKATTCNGPIVEDTVVVLPLPRYLGGTNDTIFTSETTNITFANNLIGSPATYSWTVAANPNVTGASNGTGTSLAQTLINTSTSPQTVNYTLVVTSNINGKFCQSQNNALSVLVYPNAKAQFNASTTNSCAPFNVGNVITPVLHPDANQEYFWYANNVFIGNGPVFPGYILSEPDDTVDIKLFTSSKWGALADSQITRFITPKRPAPIFASDKIQGCGPLTVNFTNSSPQFAGQTFRWTFGNGQTTTAYQPTAITFQPHPLGRDTTYQVVLEGITPCSTITYVQNITVKSAADAIFSINKTVGCSPVNLEFINKSRGSGSTFYWDFGNGETLTTTSFDTLRKTYIRASTDTIYVKLKSVNSCGIDSMGYYVIINPQTVNAEINVDALQINGCAPHTIQIINSSVGTNLHTYNFGDLSAIYQSTKAIDTVLHTYTQPGQYEIDFTAENECSSKNQKLVINVFAPPQAAFTTTRNRYCEGDEIVFSNQTSGADTYFWDFGDGNTSIQSNPRHRFYTAGQRTIKLIAYKNSTTGLICTDTTVRTIFVDPFLTPAFTSTLDTVYCGTTNINIAAQNKGQFLTYWTTGDRINSADYTQLGSNFNHTYTVSGTYTIKLFYETANGCVDSIAQNIYINNKPTAQFDASKIYLCENGTVNFSNTSTYNGTYPVKFDYEINGVRIKDSVNLTYFFDPSFTTDSFVFDVKLVAYDGLYCADSITKQIIVKKQSESIFTHNNASEACVPYTLDLSNTSKYTDFNEWYLDDELVSSDKIPNIVLTEGNKNYKLKLVTWNKAACAKDSMELNISTYPEVVSKVSTQDTLGCFGQLFVTFSNQSSNASSHTWDYGDGSARENSVSPSHFYTNPGTYQVMHIAQSVNGCLDTSYTTIKVGKNVQAKYTPSNTFGCGTLTVDFQNLSTDYVRLMWDFDDNTVSYDPNPQHTFVNRIEPYNVKLYAYNEVGCVDTFMFPTKILVGTEPVVEFDVDDTLKIIPEKTFSFTTLATSPVSFRKWDFGDGITSFEKNPIHEYRFVGKYFVTLTEIDTSGCESIYSREVEVRDLEGNLWLPNAFTPKSGTDQIRIFTPIGYGIESYKLQIYNTAGQLLFESTSLDQTGRPNEGWDGTYEGEDMPQGSYIWSIEAKFLNGTTWKGMPDSEGRLKRTGLLFIVR